MNHILMVINLDLTIQEEVTERESRGGSEGDSREIKTIAQPSLLYQEFPLIYISGDTLH